MPKEANNKSYGYSMTISDKTNGYKFIPNLLYAKYFVYKCKLQERRPHFDHFMSELKHRKIIEKSLASSIGKLNSFNNKLKIYADMFDADNV